MKILGIYFILHTTLAWDLLNHNKHYKKKKEKKVFFFLKVGNKTKYILQENIVSTSKFNI